ncbi:MAG: ABC transporter permease [Lentisphaerae bacterium]|nr:ABC transporter permease [Lentisphaerota bacterium]
MHSILAIAELTLRRAVRSRVFLLLALLVIGCIIGLPLVMKSDGTLAGQVQLFLQYTLAVTGALLAIIAVWTAAGALALEVEERHIQMVIVKPVRTWQIWLGKWLGLMVINLVMVALAATTIYGLLRWTTRPALLTPAEQTRLAEDILVARRAAQPLWPEGAAPSRANALTVAPGQSISWRFELPPHIPAGAVSLQYRFLTSHPDYQESVTGQWCIRDGAGQELFQQTVSARAQETHSCGIPVELAGDLEISYLNTETSAPLTLLFDAPDSVQLQIRVSSFASNYLRAWLMTLARLAFFSALGLTAGAAFSTPVAVFVSMALLIISAVSRWLQQVASFADAESRLDWMVALGEQTLRAAYLALELILPPLQRWDPHAFLAEGLFLSGALTAQAWLVLGGLYPALLALAGAWLLRRRELGLPTL